MDSVDLSESKCFTYTWKIKNFSYSWQKNGECISSPVFIVDTMEKTKWRLDLYPKGSLKHSMDCISFFLKRERSCRGPELFNIYFDLSFLRTDNSVLLSKGPYDNIFFKGEDWGLVRYVRHEEVWKIRREDYLPGNVLTVRCRMWCNNEANNYGHCFAWTRIAVERRSFVWNIQQFYSFKESVCEIASASDEQSIISLKFFPSSGQNSETFICVQVCAHDQKLKSSTFRLYLVDISGNRTECLNDEIVFYASEKTALFKLNFSKKELIKKRNRYLPNNAVQLYCECDIATGIMLENIEKISYGCPPSIQEENLTSDLKPKKMCLNSTRILKENLESSYKEDLLCDVNLKTKTGSFLAHKNILSARSRVFKEMFTNDVRQKNSKYVYIEDLNDDTVQRLLHYIYTATLLDLQWDSACNLYAAADKYEIPSLKNECSSFFKDSLSHDNACDILILADRYQDEDLKSTVQDYILNQRDIFNSNEWKLFMKMNAPLAAELLYLTVK